MINAPLDYILNGQLKSNQFNATKKACSNASLTILNSGGGQW